MEENPPKIISCAEAKAQGLKRYYTGKLCKHLHVAERTTCDRKCVECNLLNVARFRKCNPDKISKTNKESWLKLLTEYKREKTKRNRTNNR